MNCRCKWLTHKSASNKLEKERRWKGKLNEKVRRNMPIRLLQRDETLSYHWVTYIGRRIRMIKWTEMGRLKYENVEQSKRTLMWTSTNKKRGNHCHPEKERTATTLQHRWQTQRTMRRFMKHVILSLKACVWDHISLEMTQCAVQIHMGSGTIQPSHHHHHLHPAFTAPQMWLLTVKEPHLQQRGVESLSDSAP